MPNTYLGFDIDRYPGDGEMGWLWNHGFRISGFYLNHKRGGVDESWLRKRHQLVSAGWGLAPLYLGWQVVDSTGAPGPAPLDPDRAAAEDAAEAGGLMRQAGFPPGTTLFCDVESPALPDGSYEAYLVALFAQIRRAGFVPAVYCSHRSAGWAAQKNLACWSWNVPAGVPRTLDPGNLPRPRIDAGCVGTQFAQNVHLAGLPRAVDLDWFAVADPSRGTAAA